MMRTITQSYGMNAVEWVAYSQARDASPIHSAIRLGDADALLRALAVDEDPTRPPGETGTRLHPEATADS